MRRSPLRSPPRMRGKGGWKVSASVLCGIIPACAGKRAASAREAYFIWDHPRVCGEKDAFYPVMLSGSGSPPRMRGKAGHHCRRYRHSGITPAYAGKRSLYAGMRTWKRDHPRVCGEKGVSGSVVGQPQGSPPRMRGKECHPRQVAAVQGITPAYAGKSNVWSAPDRGM